MKTDARVRYTRHIIQSTFLELLKEKPVNKITVKELCDKAEINRGTFYKHYQDVYDLMEQLEEEALADLEKLLVSATENGSGSSLFSLLASMQNNRDLICSLSKTSINTDFINRLTDCCTRYALSTPSVSVQLDKPNRQYVYSYLAGGISRLLAHWLANGAVDDPADLAHLIDSLSTASLSVM